MATIVPINNKYTQERLINGSEAIEIEMLFFHLLQYIMHNLRQDTYKKLSFYK